MTTHQQRRPWRMAWLAVAGVALLGLGTVLPQAGWWPTHPAGVSQALAEIAREREALAEAEARVSAQLDAVAVRLATLQAELIRLNALGERLAQAGQLDAGEFDFSAPPPLGGIGGAGETQAPAALLAELAGLEQQLQDRERKLGLLEDLLLGREVLAHVHPSGRPIERGWVSSRYGYRTDPFSGKRSLHRGVDFAGKPGAEVLSTAAGVVSRADYEPGYGNVVEIRHADGYTTRYAHNQSNLVAVGDVVGKGEVIALLGSTGRSSGPHVHFEVHRDGRLLDPDRYLRPR